MKKSSRRSLLVPFVLSLCCCAKSTPGPDSGTAASRVQAPMVVTWEQLELSSSKVRLMAHIKRLAPMQAPVNVRIDVPAIARMTIGRTSFDLPANTAADELNEPVELTYPQMPVGDLVLRVTAVGQGGGAVAVVPYRFGRAPVEQTAPTADGPSVIRNGRDLGPSIPLDKNQE